MYVPAVACKNGNHCSCRLLTCIRHKTSPTSAPSCCRSVADAVGEYEETVLPCLEQFGAQWDDEARLGDRGTTRARWRARWPLVKRVLWLQRAHHVPKELPYFAKQVEDEYLRMRVVEHVNGRSQYSLQDYCEEALGELNEQEIAAEFYPNGVAGGPLGLKTKAKKSGSVKDGKSCRKPGGGVLEAAARKAPTPPSVAKTPRSMSSEGKSTSGKSTAAASGATKRASSTCPVGKTPKTPKNPKPPKTPKIPKSLNTPKVAAAAAVAPAASGGFDSWPKAAAKPSPLQKTPSGRGFVFASSASKNLLLNPNATRIPASNSQRSLLASVQKSLAGNGQVSTSTAKAPLKSILKKR